MEDTAVVLMYLHSYRLSPSIIFETTPSISLERALETVRKVNCSLPSSAIFDPEVKQCTCFTH